MGYLDNHKLFFRNQTFNKILNKTIIYALTAFQKSKHNFVYNVQFIDNEIPSCIRHITLMRVTLAVLFDKTKTVKMRMPSFNSGVTSVVQIERNLCVS